MLLSLLSHKQKHQNRQRQVPQQTQFKPHFEEVNGYAKSRNVIHYQNMLPARQRKPAASLREYWRLLGGEDASSKEDKIGAHSMEGPPAKTPTGAPSPFPNHPDWAPNVFAFKRANREAEEKKCARYKRTLKRKRWSASNHGSAAHTGCVVAAYAAYASREKANAEADGEEEMEPDTTNDVAFPAWQPKLFQCKRFRQVRVIIDSTEIRIERASASTAQRTTWSQYKNSNTIKVLVGITPNRLISYVLECWGGKISDKQLFLQTDFTKYLEYRDEVMADRGLAWKHVMEELAVQALRL
ncbi:hypothetical protein HPB49_009322 [Dermacentor silvarum]|uniref:Uncharacterized protein n=1 Tax=Dermacentor silvarum TaxID=543639 RepID=A0ACB8CQU5_DERSI|nr:hypothetical protein HPB49_009322 [Dermacentor silvarum]